METCALAFFVLKKDCFAIQNFFLKHKKVYIFFEFFIFCHFLQLHSRKSCEMPSPPDENGENSRGFRPRRPRLRLLPGLTSHGQCDVYQGAPLSAQCDVAYRVWLVVVWALGMAVPPGHVRQWGRRERGTRAIPRPDLTSPPPGETVFQDLGGL